MASCNLVECELEQTEDELNCNPSFEHGSESDKDAEPDDDKATESETDNEVEPLPSKMAVEAGVWCYKTKFQMDGRNSGQLFSRFLLTHIVFVATHRVHWMHFVLFVILIMITEILRYVHVRSLNLERTITRMLQLCMNL